jgi:hypothetical protein
MGEWTNYQMERIWKETVVVYAGNMPMCSYTDLGAPRNNSNNSVTTAGAIAKIRTGHFPNMSPDRYRS